MALADLDGDGKPELITGKQLLAHNGGDVGGLEPVFVFYYKFNKGHFERHILSYSYLEPYFGPGQQGPAAELCDRSRHAAEHGRPGRRWPHRRGGGVPVRPLRFLQ